ncbi:MAG: cytochrome c oxidase assembly protein [Chloroflexi bacterium]|nr:cytochrome c oxidase assembly protein [Chloroflexota bacterium]
MPVTPASLWTAWSPDPLILVSLSVLGWSYARGTGALWRAAGPDRGIRSWQAATFAAGVFVVAVALISPLDALADVLFSAHMAQHLLLMSVAAPSLALGAPHLALLWSVKRSSRVALGHLVQRLHWIRVLSALPVAFGVHSLALWLWHAPPLYEGALRYAPLHAFEHVVLLGTGFVFWSAAFTGLAHGGRTLGASFLYVFVLGAQCTGLGALITLSARPWYASYATSTAAWGLSARDDQALAGALMWVPAGMLYLAFALLLFGAWLQPRPAVSRAASDRLRQPRAHLPGAPAPHRTRPVE